MQRFCYLNILWSKSTGIYNKFLHQAIALKKIQTINMIIDPIAAIPVNHLQYFKGKPSAELIPIDISLPTWIQPFFLPFLVWQRLKKRLSDYDAVIMRWTVPTKKFYDFTRSQNLFTEHHTKELEELYLKKDPKSLAQLVLEKIYAPGILSNACGILGVTDEIRQYEIKRAGVQGPSMVFSNGVSVKDTPFIPHLPFNGGPLKLLFIASQFASWHGLDRVIEGLNRWQGKSPTIQLYLVGQLSKQQMNSISQFANIKTLGLLHGPELEKTFSSCHIAIGSLAVHRKGLNEACPLKVREYIARGMPFIYAYNDPDISDDIPWCLRIPSDDSPVKMEDVVDFAKKIKSIPSLSLSMRKFAVKKLDWEIKMEKMLNFARNQI